MLLTTVLATAPALASEKTCDGRIATIVGTEGPDLLVGTAGRDVIVGLGGNDTIRGLDGRDTICGGSGRDRIFGGRQADTIYGGDDGDRLFGQAGHDRLFGDRGNDRLNGGGGDDDLVGGNGRRDRLIGGSGDDACSDKQPRTTRSACRTSQLSARVDVFATATGRGGCIDSVSIEQFERPADGFVTFSLAFWHGCGGEPSFLRISERGAVSAPDSVETMRLLGPDCSAPDVSCEGTAIDTRLPVGYASVPLRLDLRGGDRRPVLGESTINLRAQYRGGNGRTADVDLQFTVLTEELVPEPQGATTPGHRPAGPWSTVWGGFGTLQRGSVELADSADDLEQIIGEIQVDGIHWPSQAAVVLAIGTDACPPVFAGFEVDGRSAKPNYRNPGYEGCIAPGLSSTTIVAVDRDWLRMLDELVAPHSGNRLPIDVSETLDDRPAPPPIVPTFNEIRGRVPVPLPGEADAHILAQGQPMIVVRHQDGTISAFDAVAPTDSAFGGRARSIVRFVGSTRNFLGGGAWDEFGRKLDGPISEDLTSFATRVVDGVVEIGDPVALPAGARLGGLTSRRAMGDARIELGDPISLAEALTLPIGHTAFVAAQVEVGPQDARMCSADPLAETIERCPDDSIRVEGFTIDPTRRTTWFSPLLVRRTGNGFDRIVTLGGSGSGPVN